LQCCYDLNIGEDKCIHYLNSRSQVVKGCSYVLFHFIPKLFSQ
jgi:hypothetical protein